MKNLLKIGIVSALIMLAASSAYAQPGAGSYRVDRYRSEVYYEGRLVPDADYRSFEDLGFGYAKDRNHVYRFGEILEYVDPSSFKVDRRFAGNGSHQHPDAHRPGFQQRPGRPGHPDGIRSQGYFKTDFGVYYNGWEMDDAHASSFTVLDSEGGYAKDSFNVYWEGRAVDGAMSSSFTVLGYGYAKDSFNVYWCGEKIDGATPSSFKVTGNGYAEDAFNAYFNGRKLK